MKLKVADIGEFGLIRRLQKILAGTQGESPDVSVGLGDDCAVFSPPVNHELLITCDSMVEGRHYLPELISPRDLGRRAMVQNVSDIGAMGGFPIHALVSLGLKPDTRVHVVEEMYRGFISVLSSFGASIIGGNTTSVASGPFIDITVAGSVRRGAVISRAGARPGDAILVTGFPGEAAAGFRLLAGDCLSAGVPPELVDAYLRPDHRAVEGRAAAEQGYLTAMIDTSDGLAADLGHICSASGVGARLEERFLPVRRPLLEAAGLLGVEPVDLILGASDDYELLITCPLKRAGDVRAALSGVAGVKVSAIGTITDETGEVFLVSGHSEKPIDVSGWDHFNVRGSSG